MLVLGRGNDGIYDMLSDVFPHHWFSCRIVSVKNLAGRLSYDFQAYLATASFLMRGEVGHGAILTPK